VVAAIGGNHGIFPISHVPFKEKAGEHLSPLNKLTDRCRSPARQKMNHVALSPAPKSKRSFPQHLEFKFRLHSKGLH
jgi:hypothetical protein